MKFEACFYLEHYVIMKTSERRMVSFFEVASERLGSEVGETLKGIWAEVCVYTKCTTLVKKGKRQGQECGKACPYGHTQCMCHLPRHLFQTTDRVTCEYDSCTRLCKKGEALCPTHLNPCQYIMTKGKNKDNICAKKSYANQLCKQHSSKTNQENEPENKKKSKKAKKAKKEKRKEEQEEERKEEEEQEQEEEQPEEEEQEEEEEEEEKQEEPGSPVNKYKSYSPELPDPEDEYNPFDQYPEEEEEEYYEESKSPVKPQPKEQVKFNTKSPVKENTKSPAKQVKPQQSNSSCAFVLTSGVHKGKPCGKKCMEGKDMCVIHKKK